MTENPLPGRLRRVRVVLWALVTVVALSLGGALLWRAATPDPLPAPSYTEEAEIRSEFSLIDHTGQRVTQADYAGRWQLVFFGFTHCPDICPTTLAYMGAVLDELGAAADRVAPLFVTVDPVRDTVPVMAEYVGAFHPRLIGLTGSESEVAAATYAFKAYAERVSEPAARDGYAMAHSAHIYLMSPEGRFIDVFQERDLPPEALADEISAQIQNEA